MIEPVSGRLPESFALGALRELLEQSTRLATAAVLFCAIVASANHDPGAELACALAVYLVRVALPVFLVSYLLDASRRLSRARWLGILQAQRGSLDAAVRLLFAVHWTAIAAYLYVSRSEPLPFGVVGGAFGALGILVRPALAALNDARSRFRYELLGDVTWLVYVGFYVRVLLAGGVGTFSTPREAVGYLLVLGSAFAFRVWGSLRR